MCKHISYPLDMHLVFFLKWWYIWVFFQRMLVSVIQLMSIPFSWRVWKVVMKSGRRWQCQDRWCRCRKSGCVFGLCVVNFSILGSFVVVKFSILSMLIWVMLFSGTYGSVRAWVSAFSRKSNEIKVSCLV